MTQQSRRSSDDDPEYSDRGFAHWLPVQGTYDGKVKVYESSAAMAPHLWVAVEGTCHLSGSPEPHAGLPWGMAPGGTAAHLTMDAARELRDKLDAAIRHSEERFDG